MVEAEACKNASSSLTCAAIVRCCLNIEDRKQRWMDDAENFIPRGSTECVLVFADGVGRRGGDYSPWLQCELPRVVKESRCSPHCC